MNQLLKYKAMKATHTIQGVSPFCALIWKHKNHGISFNSTNKMRQERYV